MIVPTLAYGEGGGVKNYTSAEISLDEQFSFHYDLETKVTIYGLPSTPEIKKGRTERKRKKGRKRKKRKEKKGRKRKERKRKENKENQ